MGDFGDKRNAEGYHDPTPYQAIKNMIKPGEIWTFQRKDNTEAEVLVVAFSDNVATILYLMDDYKDGCIEVVSKGVKYVNPRMLNWSWGGFLGKCVRKLSVQEFNQVGVEIEKILAIRIVKEADSMANEYADRYKEAKADAERYRIQLDLIKGMYSELMEKFLQRA